MCKINLWNTIPPCFQNQPFFNKISKNQPNQPFDFIFSHFHWFYWILRVFSSENTPTRYFTIFVPLKSQANFKMSPNCPKFLINDVIPEVVIIFRLRNIFFWIQRSFLHYNRSNKFFRRVNTFWFKSISMWRYDPLKQSFLLRSAQVTSSPKLIWGTQFWAHLKSPKISNFQKSISSSKNIFFGCGFFC